MSEEEEQFLASISGWRVFLEEYMCRGSEMEERVPDICDVAVARRLVLLETEEFYGRMRPNVRARLNAAQQKHKHNADESFR
jgi:hypothetical protein